MKIKYVIVFIFVFFLFVGNGYAACSDQELGEKTAVASDVKISYQHIEKGTFKLIVSNLTKDLFLIDDVNKQYIYGEGVVLELSTYYGGNTYNFRVFSKSGGCKDLKLTSIAVSLPKYNSFSDDYYCVTNPEFKYCDPWYNGYIDNAEFTRAKDEYELSKIETPVNWYTAVINGVISFVTNNIILLGGALLFILILLIILIVRKKKARKEIKL